MFAACDDIEWKVAADRYGKRIGSLDNYRCVRRNTGESALGDWRVIANHPREQISTLHQNPYREFTKSCDGEREIARSDAGTHNEIIHHLPPCLRSVPCPLQIASFAPHEALG